MTDTVKIPRPRFVRRKGGPSGRTEHDERGNAVWVRTRATDAAGAPSAAELSLVDEGQLRSHRAPPKARAPKGRKSG